MLYQLVWKILPGLRGMACSEFRALATQSPDNERGVVVNCATLEECGAVVRELEEHFREARFSNQAAAFEAVKDFVLTRLTNKSQSANP